HKLKPVTKKDASKSSAKSSVTQSRENLTLADWFTVFKFIDEHPQIPQTQVVNHFKTCKDGALIFTQPTLSRKLEQRAEVKSCGDSNPNALSSKQPHIVTHPDARACTLSVGSSHGGRESDGEWAHIM
ncbi:hypothetical protein EI94DRAFT_1875459, partial [Lactarius quietus]